MPGTFTVYKPHKPELSTYYQFVEDRLEVLEQVHDDRFAKQYGFLWKSEVFSFLSVRSSCTSHIQQFPSF